MPQIIVTESAALGLERCRGFLAAKVPEAARRAARAIEQQFLLLETTPEIGRPFPENAELRELLITFGDSGYVAEGRLLRSHLARTVLPSTQESSFVAVYIIFARKATAKESKSYQSLLTRLRSLSAN